MGTFINAFFQILTLNNFFAYPLGFGFVIACFGLALKLFHYKTGGGR